jgi:hypothetical protein
VVVFITRKDGVRRVETVAEVTGLTATGYALEPVGTDLQLILPTLMTNQNGETSQ